MIFALDGRDYGVEVEKLTRRAAVLPGVNAGTLKSGRKFYDVVGTRYDYDLTASPRLGAEAEYEALRAKLLEGKAVEAAVPFAQDFLAFEARAASASDSLLCADSVELWGSLEFSLTAQQPQRREATAPPGGYDANALLVVDGVAYRVMVAYLSRLFEIEDGAGANTSLSGVAHGQPAGAYYAFALELDSDLTAPEEYDALYDVLTAPAEEHKLEIVNGGRKLVLQAHVSAAEDELISCEEAFSALLTSDEELLCTSDDEALGWEQNENIWGNLVVNLNGTTLLKGG